MDSDAKFCGRTQCKCPIGHDLFYRIWNQPSKWPGYRDYCCQCGRGIIQHNIKMVQNGETSISLSYLIMLPLAKAKV
jgi:hypothetical protein